MKDDALRNALADRMMPMAPTGLPAPPPAKPSRVPPAVDRYTTGLKMQHAIANNWEPNPTLIRLLGGK